MSCLAMLLHMPDADPTSIRFVSPKDEESNGNDDFDPTPQRLGQHKELKVDARILSELHSDNELNNSERPEDANVGSEADLFHSLKEISSYDGLLGAY